MRPVGGILNRAGRGPGFATLSLSFLEPTPFNAVCL